MYYVRIPVFAVCMACCLVAPPGRRPSDGSLAYSYSAWLSRSWCSSSERGSWGRSTRMDALAKVR